MDLHEVIGWQKETKSTKTINKDSINNRINLLTLHSHGFVRGKHTHTHTPHESRYMGKGLLPQQCSHAYILS
jgi:hypothetical protein